MTTRIGPIALAALIWLVAAPADASVRHPCAGLKPTITGSSQSDTITGTRGDDVIRTGGSDDRIDGVDGNDTVCAGPGDDVITVGPGADRIRAGGGDDHAESGGGGDQILGQGGADEADGGDGIDACVVEDHENCEADLSVSADGPIPFTAGDQHVFAGRLIVTNFGPSDSLRTLGTGKLPPEAEFVAGSSDPRCSETHTDEITCIGDGIEVQGRIEFSVAFRFPDCPPPNHSITFTADAQDYLTTDPVPGNNHYAISTPLTPAPACP